MIEILFTGLAVIATIALFVWVLGLALPTLEAIHRGLIAEEKLARIRDYVEDGRYDDPYGALQGVEAVLNEDDEVDA